jgi:hypothetical protein
MLSRIGDFINPPQPKGEADEKVAEHPDQKNRKGSQQKDEAPVAPDDGTFFSIEAIRALLKQENAAGADILAYLDLLQECGVTSIPIKNEQSIPAAIADAASRIPRR